MKKIEKAINLEAARILMIEGCDLFQKGVVKLEEVKGVMPAAQYKEYDKAITILSKILTQVVMDQNELGIKW